MEGFAPSISSAEKPFDQALSALPLFECEAESVRAFTLADCYVALKSVDNTANYCPIRCRRAPLRRRSSS